MYSVAIDKLEFFVNEEFGFCCRSKSKVKSAYGLF